MPRLVDKSVGVVARIRESEPKFAGALRQPNVSGCVGERFRQGKDLGGPYVDGAACVVFAVAGDSDRGQNVLDSSAQRELAANDFDLSFNTPKTRNRNELD